MRGAQVQERGHPGVRGPGPQGLQVQMQAGIHRQILRAGANLQEEENKEICRGERLQVLQILSFIDLCFNIYFAFQGRENWFRKSSAKARVTAIKIAAR